MMNEYLTERFLKQYFLIRSVCLDHIDEENIPELFCRLAELFALDDPETLEEYYACSETPIFAELNDLASYQRLCRTMEFARRSGQRVSVTAMDRLILSQKKEALNAKNVLFRHDKNLTREAVCEALLSAAANGNTDAMGLLSFMEYNGLCIDKNEERALARIRVLAGWNDLFGNLMGIAYDPAGCDRYLGILHTVLSEQGRSAAFENVLTKSGRREAPERDRTARILEKAFALGAVERGIYDRLFARVAFSRVLSVKDKEKLLLNRQKENISSLSAYPFDLDVQARMAFDEECMAEPILQREGEKSRILQNLTVARDCPVQAYTPLLVVSGDEYLSEMYRKALKKGLKDTALVELDAAALTEQDFFGGVENVFLRGLSLTGKARTTFMIRHCEALSDPCLTALEKVLDLSNRKNFKLFSPAVNLDLSGLTFVLLASEKNTVSSELSEYCDTVWVKDVTKAEKELVVNEIFRSRADSFGVSLDLEEGCTGYLGEFDTRTVRQIVDEALRRAVFERTECVTLSLIKECGKDQRPAAVRRGFGYMGGKNYA